MDQPDFRALCAEFVEALKDENTYTQRVELIDRARAALSIPPPELSEAEGIAEWLYERGRLQDLGTRDWYFRASDLLKQLAAVKAAPPPEPPTVMEILAARPLLEHVARLGDRIGANTVGEVMAISNRAAAWLKANPPGQPVAIEPRGCPTPGACSCVEPATPPPEPPKNCWLDDEPDLFPSPCVFDDPDEVIDNCVYAQIVKCKTDCKYYRVAVHPEPVQVSPPEQPTKEDLMQFACKYFDFRGNSQGEFFFATSIEAKTDPYQSLTSFAHDVLERWGK